MRYLAGDRWYLSDFTPSMKIALTFFLVFVLLGLATSLALQYNQTRFELDRASTYYRGNKGQADVRTFHVEKSYRRLLEVAHFHLYIMPVVYLAFVHLYFLTRRSEAEKSFVSLVTFGALLAEVTTPWLVRFHTGDWAVLFWFAGLGITLPTLWMSGVCLWELWGASPRDPGRSPNPTR